MAKNIKNIMELNVPAEYELQKEENLEELKSFGIVLQHKKSGARLIVLSNDDNNKVFSIGFRTPPADSTGVAHIIEHTVLCGSRKFPSKDPFVELVKGSLNTFLNAMTYPDKTIYPVASCNDKDFQNLMDVYLDAVFHPNIYEKKEIFRQEGWHYELEEIDAPLKYNGVVYNEMKGAFSSPEQLLYRQIQHSLFPDTSYGTESGGDPNVIPELTYENYLSFHGRYYHPTNSFIYLYGDMDIEEKLKWLDKEYLCEYNEITIDSEIKMQKPFETLREESCEYSIAEDDTTEEKTYLSYNAVVGTSLDRKLYLAFQIIDYVLLEAPGAPLKQALLDKGIGNDILSSYDNGMLQPMFSIIAKNTEEEKKEEFVKVIKDTLKKIVQEGINHKALKAAINYFEFKYREADFGQYPKGLMYGIQILDSWLYDDTKPFIHIRANDTFEFLKENIATGYYEQLIQKYLIDNTHASLLAVKPKAGLNSIKEQELEKELSDYKAKLSQVELEQLVEGTKHLTAYQEEPSSKEDMEKIPLLSREDIDKKAQQFYNQERTESGVKVVYHDVFTNGIGYVKMLFDTENLPKNLIPYIGLLSTVLGYVDTKEHSFLEFSNEVNIHTGGITTAVATYNKAWEFNNFKAYFEVNSKMLYEEMGTAFSLIKEMIFDAKFTDEKRMLEILQEIKSRMQMKMNSAGHVIAISRASAYESQSAYFDELTSGISYYQFIEELIQNYEEKKAEIKENLEKSMTYIFRKENIILSFTADEAGYKAIQREIASFAEILYTEEIVKEKAVLQPMALNEGFKISSQVQYVARTGNFINAGYKYTGALKILKIIFNYDYLWINLRVKGGAYGCMSGFAYSGNSYMVSYRDPNLSQTNDIYNKAAEYVRYFQVDERDMTKYIIGTVSGLDTPLTPSGKGAVSMNAYLIGVTETDIQKERDEILSADVNSIRVLADLIQAVLDTGNICVVGNEKKIEENKKLFKEIKNLM